MVGAGRCGSRWAGFLSVMGGGMLDVGSAGGLRAGGGWPGGGGGGGLGGADRGGGSGGGVTGRGAPPCGGRGPAGRVAGRPGRPHRRGMGCVAGGAARRGGCRDDP